jgi:hypothetical protein
LNFILDFIFIENIKKDVKEVKVKLKKSPKEGKGRN